MHILTQSRNLANRDSPMLRSAPKLRRLVDLTLRLVACNMGLVAELIRIDDPSDERMVDYTSLRDVQLRKHLEVACGLFLAEGEKVVRRAVAAGYPVRSFLMAERWLPGLDKELTAAGGVPCFVVSEEVAEVVTGFHVHRGALASLHRVPLPPVSEVLAGARSIVVVEDIVDHTNLGAIFRCAAALDVDGILLSPRCADPLYRRSIKVAMGAVFSLPWTRMEGWYDVMPQLSQAGFTTVALTPSGETDLAAAAPDLVGKVCIVVGAEGHGLSRRWLSSADVRVRIPMAGGVDSLNVAAAAAIACYVIQTRG